MGLQRYSKKAGVASMSTKHEWECEDCGRFVMFRQPELPQDDYSSEQNENKSCVVCGGHMFFDDVPDFKATVCKVPTAEQIAQALEDEEDDDG